MKQLAILSILLPIFAVITMMGCSDLGAKVKIIGTKGEVFYKDGATADDAKKIGDYLKEQGYLSNDRPANVQVTKPSSDYVVRLVYNKSYFEANQYLEKEFKRYGAEMSEKLFNDKQVSIILSDEKFKDFKVIPFEANVAKKETESTDNPLAPPSEPSIDDFDHDKQDNITFFWKGMTDKESKAIADYITQAGDLAGPPIQLFLVREGARYTIKFPVKPEYQNNESYNSAIDVVARKIKTNLFPNSPFSFQLTDEKLVTTKSFDYD
jgi:hypothetical protein